MYVQTYVKFSSLQTKNLWYGVKQNVLIHMYRQKPYRRVATIQRDNKKDGVFHFYHSLILYCIYFVWRVGRKLFRKKGSKERSTMKKRQRHWFEILFEQLYGASYNIFSFGRRTKTRDWIGFSILSSSVSFFSVCLSFFPPINHFLKLICFYVYLRILRIYERV